MSPLVALYQKDPHLYITLCLYNELQERLRGTSPQDHQLKLYKYGSKSTLVSVPSLVPDSTGALVHLSVFWEKKMRLDFSFLSAKGGGVVVYMYMLMSCSRELAFDQVFWQSMVINDLAVY